MPLLKAGLNYQKVILFLPDLHGSGARKGKVNETKKKRKETTIIKNRSKQEERKNKEQREREREINWMKNTRVPFPSRPC